MQNSGGMKKAFCTTEKPFIMLQILLMMVLTIYVTSVSSLCICDVLQDNPLDATCESSAVLLIVPKEEEWQEESFHVDYVDTLKNGTNEVDVYDDGTVKLELSCEFNFTTTFLGWYISGFVNDDGVVDITDCDEILLYTFPAEGDEWPIPMECDQKRKKRHLFDRM